MASRGIRLRSTGIAIFCGVIASLATGLVERSIISIPEIRYYGYPLVWRVTQTLQQPYTTEFRFTSLAIDTAFWIIISLVALVILGKILKKTSSSI